jgi:hypothetical protein|tara:strand:- start:60 stop:545 length:486 start_codon:yes stop_codon:yes gene_type:complete
MEEIKEEVAVEEVEESLDNENIKQLRQEYKKLKAENKQYKAVAMDSALTSIGLSSDKGLGKAVTKLYDGDVTVDAITDFVSKEFGEVNAINADTTPAAPPNQNVIEAQSRVEQLNKLGVESTPADSFSDLNAFINNPETSVRSSISAKLHAIDAFDEQTKK